MSLCRTSLFRLTAFAFAIALPVGAAMAAGAGDNKVGGTGTIIPRGGVIRVVGVPGYAIKKIDVEEGQKIAQGTPLFELDTTTYGLGLTMAENDLATAKKDAEFHTQIEVLTLKLSELRLQHAKRDAANYKAVGPGGTSEKELSRLQQVIEENQGALDIEKVHAQELQFDLVSSVRAAALHRDISASGLDQFTVRAPVEGTVLKIEHQTGERTDGGPVIEFADLTAMYVSAQIYQGDMLKVKTGMKVTIKNSAFPNLATGRVETVGTMIGSRSQLGDVLIRLDKNDPADRLVGMEVEVVIGP